MVTAGMQRDWSGWEEAMASVESLMPKCDPRMEKENLVPRSKRPEPGSGLGSVRARGLASSEHRSSTVLKESAMQNMTPAPVSLSKANLGSTEKVRLKVSSSDFYKGKTTTGSLERLKEKIGQLKSVSALMQSTQKTPSTQEFHTISGSNTQGSTATGSDPVQVYRDVKVSSSGGHSRESSNLESHRHIRENSRIASMSILEPLKTSSDIDFDESVKTFASSTPTKSSNVREHGSTMQTRSTSSSNVYSRSSNGTVSKKKLPTPASFETKDQSVQNKTDAVVQNSSVKHLLSSFPIIEKTTFKDLNSLNSQVLDVHDNNLKAATGESARSSTSPEGAEKSSLESSANSSLIAELEKHSRMNIIKRSKCSRFGPPLRVRRDDPRTSPKDNHSPGSETSIDNDRQSPEVLVMSKADEKDRPTAIPRSVPNILANDKDKQSAKGHSAAEIEEDQHNDLRKRKAEADPSTTDSSFLLTELDSDKQKAGVSAMEVQKEVLNKGGNIRDHDRMEASIGRNTRREMSVLEQSGESFNEEIPDRPLTEPTTKGTPGTEREPWAWKTPKDSRAMAHPSPTLPESSKTGKVGGMPPRYVPPTLGSREAGLQRPEFSDIPALDGQKHYTGDVKPVNDIDRNDLNKIAKSQSYGKGPIHSDEAAVNHLSSTLSTITLEDKSSSGSGELSKQSLHGRTPTHASGQHLYHVPAESGSLTGVTGVTGVTSQSNGTSQKAVVPSSQGGELQQKPHIPQAVKESIRTESSDHNGHSKPSARASVSFAEVLVHEGHSGHSAKSSDPPKERGEKNQENPHPNLQPQRKGRMETENDNFVYVNGIRYQKLGKIGKGGSSEVFKVIATNCSIYALKRVNLKGKEWGTAQEFYQEIKYLEALRGKRHIIQLVDSEVTNKKVLDRRWKGGDITEDAFIYMVLEYGEIDLAGMLSAKRREMQSKNESKIDENWLRFHWQQILEAVQTIHDERIVHSDLKPANFMLVKGELKLIDFGIAKAIQNDTTNIVRDSQAGTLNYMSPEACLQNQTDDEGVEIKQGRASDIWSLGCILYQMVYGQTPFAELSFYSKIQAITNPHHKIHYPPVSNPWLLDIMKRCLTWDRRKRLRIPELLQHPFLQPHLAPLIPIRHLLSIGLSKDQIRQTLVSEIKATMSREWVEELCEDLQSD